MGKKQIVKNDLPGLADSYVAHVRPHTGKSAYKLKDGTIIGDIEKHGDELPNGEWMTKQSFWLNASYVAGVIKELLSNDRVDNRFAYNYANHDEYLIAAENEKEYGNLKEDK